MARFAKDILQKFREMVKQMVVELGPDTEVCYYFSIGDFSPVKACSKIVVGSFAGSGAPYRSAFRPCHSRCVERRACPFSALWGYNEYHCSKSTQAQQNTMTISLLTFSTSLIFSEWKVLACQIASKCRKRQQIFSSPLAKPSGSGHAKKRSMPKERGSCRPTGWTCTMIQLLAQRHQVANQATVRKSQNPRDPRDQCSQ